LIQGGNLINRDQFIKGGILTTNIFLNAAGFLRISQDTDAKPFKPRHIDEDVQDPLDDTRIHPEDYELARKMATDALELDEEDVHDEHPSHVVSLIMQDNENDRKLSELNLDEFAISMYDANEDRKRHTLNLIREELLKPFAERRSPFIIPNDWDILKMLSGELEHTLQRGVMLTVLVHRVTAQGVEVRLDSGVGGLILPNLLTDDGPVNPHNIVKKGQTILAVISEDFKPRLSEGDEAQLMMSATPGDLSRGRTWTFKKDDRWNQPRQDRDLEMLARKKRAEVDQTRRVIKHPNFHNFNTAQAEAFLEKQQRGDVVIRPSSKGIDHLAVTWKVDDRLYQHIGRSLGLKLLQSLIECLRRIRAQ